MTDLKKQIDELAGIKADMSKLKARKDKLEAEIIMQCSEDLKTPNIRVSITQAQNLNLLRLLLSRSKLHTILSCSPFLVKRIKMQLPKRQNILSLLRQRECSSDFGKEIL